MRLAVGTPPWVPSAGTGSVAPGCWHWLRAWVFDPRRWASSGWPLPFGVTHAAPTLETPVQGLYTINGKSSSTDWAGYAVTGAGLKTVSGSWKQPTVKCPVNQVQQAAFWVGIDGFSGTTPRSSRSGPTPTAPRSAGKTTGTPNYYAWYEMYPQKVMYLSKGLYPVSPGNVIGSRVSHAGTTYALTISDTTRGWTFTTKSGRHDDATEFLRRVDRRGTLLGRHALRHLAAGRLPHDPLLRGDRRRQQYLRVRTVDTPDHHGHLGWDGEGLHVCALGIGW